MKPLPLIFCLLLLVTMPMVSGDTISAQFSTGGPGTPETPPVNASAYTTDAKAAVAERNWTHALLLTTQGTAWYPDNAELLCLQGYTLRKMGKSERAVDVVSKGILLDPKPVRYANRGYAYLALGNNTAALADAETGISLNPAYPTSWDVKALALQRMGRTPEAPSSVDRAIALEPKNAHYRHVKGMLLAAAGDCSGARDALEQSLALDPDYALPYPGFPGAREDLVSPNATCTPATPLPSPTKSMACCGIAGIGIAGAFLIVRMRK
jgi:tetratricopeptide (TPR) repeat protein